MSPVTVALPTLGCKANRYDSDSLARVLQSYGYVIVPARQAADVYIVNTCTVTGEADAKSRKVLRHTMKINEHATLIVTGCYASQAPEILRGIPGVDAVVPITEQHRIPELLLRLRPTTPLESNAAPRQQSLTASIERTRAIVKIQDGCNLRCAFCAVTLARGALRSRPLTEVMAELAGLLENGVQEIVLTGIRLDAYGLDLSGQRLSDLLDASTALAIPRLRLSSLEPIGINAHLVSRMAAHATLCHHFHVCLQSGNDAILHAMRRGYSTARYRRVLQMLRQAMPDATFATDIMVGFPGETEEAFADTCAFVTEMGFIKLHIFKYSSRPGTAAALLRDQVTDQVKEIRSQSLFQLEQQLFQAYAHQCVGQILPVLVERAGKHGNGLTAQYMRVHAAFPDEMTGKICPTIIYDFNENLLLGRIAI